LWVLEQELDGVFNSFIHDDFTSNNRLTGEFLLGYHCQRSALPLKKEDQEKIDSEDKDAVE
jgi:CRISPR-associated protein Csd1